MLFDKSCAVKDNTRLLCFNCNSWLAAARLCAANSPLQVQRSGSENQRVKMMVDDASD